MHPEHLSRRRFLASSAGTVAAGSLLTSESFGNQPAGSRQATGVKVGEVTDTSAIVLMRVTENATHNADGRSFGRVRGMPLPKDVNIADLRGACPGARGRVRFRYGPQESLQDARTTEWTDVGPDSDFSHQFRIAGLQPHTVYFYAAETSGPGGKPEHAPLRGRFRTAPSADDYRDISFMVISCTSYKDLDHRDGFNLYPSMAALNPSFYIHTGDNVYYDSDNILANRIDVARHHWHRMHGQPRAVAFHQQVPCLFEKDDHDTYHDDCWPGRVNKRMSPLTFERGLRIFREQVPMGDRTYRSFRWGRGLEIWLTEGRDFRSPNTMPDGPDKSIWGKEQKQWLMQSLLASNADYKVLVSPTPIIGPDRPTKRDNHSNRNFQHEGDEFRRWAQKNLGNRFFICCGDRHWQYHSIHPETRLNEFACGAGSNIHAGGSPGFNKKYHQFHRVSGGFLQVAFRRAEGKSQLTFSLRDVMGKEVYQFRAP